MNLLRDRSRHGAPAGTVLPSARGAANGRNIGELLFKLTYRTTVVGGQFVPRVGPVIVAANHIGFLDGPLLFSASPRPLHLVAKSELFKPPANRLLAACGQIPLIYDSPDWAAVQEAVNVLEAGRALGIFPEAHRGLGNFGRMRHGIAYLYARTRTPIVPAAVFGTRVTGMGKDALPRPRSQLTVVFGEPFRPEIAGDRRKRSVLAELAERIRQQLRDHLQTAAELAHEPLPTDDTALATERALARERNR